MLAVYVSGHGFGHVTRTSEVLAAVRARRPDLPILVTTAAPAWLFTRVLAPPLEVRAVACDVGLAQKDALHIDEPGTAARCRAFDAGFEALADAEAGELRRRGARLVFGDVPPLAFAAAHRAGLPAIGMGNFTWDWIYRHLAPREPDLARSAEIARAAYATAELLLALPFAGDLSAFRRREEVGFVARRPALARDEARRRLGLAAERRPVVLYSFGGSGMPAVTRERLGPAAPIRFVFPDELAQDRLDALELRYEDALGCVDAVVTKPGYGIVTDCIGARVPMIYTDRGDFPEYPIMVAEMARWLPAVHVDGASVQEGRVDAALARVRAMPWPPPPDLEGASRAAARLLERLR